MQRLLHPLASRTRWSRSSTGTRRRARSSAAARAPGINLSNIRGSMEPLSKGGTASGPVSFMRGADAWAGTIKSGGKTRRAAKMVVLDVDHPDIREFIWCKAKEEDKAAALRDAGFDMSIDGDGFHSIQYQNANNSVRVTDEFMHAVEHDARLAPDRARDRRADRRPMPRARAHARDRRGRVALRRPRRPVRHDDQPVAHVARTRVASTRPIRASRRRAGAHDARSDADRRAVRARRGRRETSASTRTARPPTSRRSGVVATPPRRVSCATGSSRSSGCASPTAASCAARPTTGSGRSTGATCARTS